MSPVRWSLSPLDYRAHAIVEGDSPLGVLVDREALRYARFQGITTRERSISCARKW